MLNTFLTYRVLVDRVRILVSLLLDYFWWGGDVCCTKNKRKTVTNQKKEKVKSFSNIFLKTSNWLLWPIDNTHQISDHQSLRRRMPDSILSVFLYKDLLNSRPPPLPLNKRVWSPEGCFRGSRKFSFSLATGRPTRPSQLVLERHNWHSRRVLWWRRPGGGCTCTFFLRLKRSPASRGL